MFNTKIKLKIISEKILLLNSKKNNFKIRTSTATTASTTISIN